MENGIAKFNLSFVNANKAVQSTNYIDVVAASYSYSTDTFYTGSCNKMYITGANGGGNYRIVGYSLLTQLGTLVPCYNYNNLDIKTFSCSVPTNTYIKLAMNTGGSNADVYIYSWFLTKE